MLWDLKDARERLKANSQTSSRPPRSDPPWHGNDHAGRGLEAAGKVKSAAEVSAARPAAGAEPSDVAAPAAGTTPASAADETPKKPGRRGGAPGHSRQVNLPVSETVIHAPESCVCCGQALEPAGFIAGTGLYILEIEMEPGAGLRGLRVRHDKHLYGELTCRCGHVNRSASPAAAPPIPCGPWD
jgi:transposase